MLIGDTETCFSKETELIKGVEKQKQRIAIESAESNAISTTGAWEKMSGS